MQRLKAAAKAAPVVIGATAGAVASSSSSVAEAQSLSLSAEKLHESGVLLKSQLKMSSDGTPWIIPASPDAASDDEDTVVVDPAQAIDAVLALSQLLIQDKEVQAKIVQHAQAQGLLGSGLGVVSIESWPSPSESPTDSYLLDNLSDGELERLREENGELRKENSDLRAQVPPTEAGEQEETPAALASLPTAQPLHGSALVKLSVDAIGDVHVRCTGAADAPPSSDAGGGATRPRTSSQKRKETARLRQAAIVATAIVVGVLAITITRNPKATKAAVAGAAAMVASLFVAEQAAEQQVAAKRH